MLKLLERAAGKGEGRWALHDSRQGYTYGRLVEAVLRMAGHLQGWGVGPGTSVAIHLPNSVEFAVSYAAALATGADVLLLPTGLRAEEVRYYRSLIRPVIAVIDSPFRSMWDAAEGTASAKGSPRLLARGESHGLEGLWAASPPEPFRPPSREGGVFQYSSGSTGKPKGVRRRAEQLRREAASFLAATNLGPEDRILAAVPLFHSHGLCNALYAGAAAGAAVYLQEQFHRREALETISSERITAFPGVPFMFGLLADTRMPAETTLASLRLCFSAGAELPPALWDRFHERWGIPIRQLYGTTETGALTFNLDEDIRKTAASVGRPLPDVEVAVLGEDRAAMPLGAVGEVAVRSPAMAGGYREDPGGGKGAFRDGWFFPGDLGFMDEGGRLYITGRKSLFINVAGKKVDPVEVEQVIARHPQVREVVVLGIPGYYGQEAVKAVVVAHSTCHAEEIVEFCHQSLADYKVPRIVEFREEIPRSMTGKILRKYLMDHPTREDGVDG